MLLLLRAGTPEPADAVANVDLRDALVRLLLQLPPRQRTVLVLRYWEQLTEAETVAVLGWPEGTVKSAASRGLRRLRCLAESPEHTGPPEPQLNQAELRPQGKGATGMNMDVEDLLRDGIERLTAGVRAPGGLAYAATAAHRQRRRGLAIRSAVACGGRRCRRCGRGRRHGRGG